MATNRKLINFLPHFMQDYVEMQKIMEVEQSEFDLLWDAAKGLFSDQFIQDATKNGVARWETMLGISPKGTDTLEERKFRIFTKLNQELPYTLGKLHQVLTNLCGADGYSIEMNAAEYHVEVKLGISNANNYSEVESVLKKMLPANMTQLVSIKYNANTVLSQFTHSQLSAYTHDQLRKEVFE